MNQKIASLLLALALLLGAVAWVYGLTAGSTPALWVGGGLVLMAMLVWLVWRRSAGAAASSGPAWQEAVEAGAPAVPRAYSPQNVGNDASARPWERNTTSFEARSAASRESVQPGPKGALGDFDVDGFLRASRANFLSLQEAWDRADIATLRSMMTEAMLAEIKGQLAERERQKPGEIHRTEVVMLEARLLGLEPMAEGHVASVEFSGLIREDPSAGPNPFREVWNITRVGTGGGWLVAGVQALQ